VVVADSFGLTAAETNGVMRLTLVGEIDFEAATSGDAAELLTRSPAPVEVCVDMASVTFLDSAGLNFLLRLHQRASTMSLINVPAAAMLVLRTSGLVDYFNATTTSPTKPPPAD
jgi:anti-anti-sigma factor